MSLYGARETSDFSSGDTTWDSKKDAAEFSKRFHRATSKEKLGNIDIAQTGNGVIIIAGEIEKKRIKAIHSLLGYGENR